MPTYRIVADESWTHNNFPLKRYHCIFGGVMAEEPYFISLRDQLNQIKKKAKKEIKWTNIDEGILPLFQEYIDTFFALFKQTPTVIFRQLHNSRVYLHKPTFDQTQGLVQPFFPKINNVFGVDAQFMIYHEFLKHSFGLDQLPNNTNLIFELDNFASQAHVTKLRKLISQDLGKLSNIVNSTVDFVKSSRHPLMPAVDLIAGAFGFLHNRVYKIRSPGQRGMNKKQKMRLIFAKLIQNHLAAISNLERKALAFIWTESTGKNSNAMAQSQQKILVWKFKPTKHYHDEGWLNENTKDGLTYHGAQLNSFSLDAGANTVSIDPSIRFVWRR